LLLPFLNLKGRGLLRKIACINAIPKSESDEVISDNLRLSWSLLVNLKANYVCLWTQFARDPSLHSDVELGKKPTKWT